MPPKVAGHPGLEVEEVLDRGRHAVELPELRAAGERLLGVARRRARVVEAEMDERVEARVARLDALDRRLEHFDGRQLAPADPSGKLRNGRVSQVVG